jgi:hypothetical protein
MKTKRAECDDKVEDAVRRLRGSDDQLCQRGTIRKVFFGKEDHGILTCSIDIDFGVSHQSFGNLGLGHLGKDFVRGLCDVFGVAKLDKLVGKKCYALRCSTEWNTPIEGLETESGRRFLLTEWRKKHFPETKSALEDERNRLKHNLESVQVRENRIREQLRTLDARHKTWEPQ